jgi:acetoin utilization deacetylase AcuC-like enzyme
MLRRQLSESGIFDFAPAPLAEAGVVERVHDPDYVRAFIDGRLDAAAVRRIGFPWSEALVARTLASAGGTLAAAGEALRSGWGGTLAGGTHHAFRDAGSGYCVFNDLAIAIADMRAGARVQRAAVIDLDVHQGDGTAAIFAGDPDVLTVSLHGAANFPFRKQQSSIDIEFADGTGDGEYLERLAGVLPRVREFGAGVVLFQSGVDALVADRLGRLSLTHEGLRERDRMVFAFARAGGIPLVVTLGGGYAEPVEETVRAHAQTFLLAAEMLGGG